MEMSMMVPSGILPTVSLLDSLRRVSKQVVSVDKLPSVQVRNVTTLIRRVKLLSSLFEEIQEAHTPLPTSCILCLTEMCSVITRVKLLIQDCKDGSYLWSLIQIELISNQFYVLVKDMGRALDILPLSLLNITADTREQVELVHKQAERVDLFVDPVEIQRREDLLQLMMANTGSNLHNNNSSSSNNNNNTNNNNRNNRGFINFGKLQEILSSIGLTEPSDYDEEISKLEAEAQKQAGIGGLMVVSNIYNLISLVSYTKSMISNHFDQQEKSHDAYSSPSSSQSSLVRQNIPNEFRCPISLDLMKDPVIVSSGHTYDRNLIAQWINSGHHTCPKSGQRLIHTALIPNYALKSLVHQWCHDNNIPLVTEQATSCSSSNMDQNANIDHISANKAAIDAVKMTAEFLVGKLATGSADIQRQAAYELRLLAKTGMENRRIIAEAGAIPFLVTLLGSHDPRIQENAVTALFNLSIFDNNKVLIVAAGAVDYIIDVLESARTMEAKENAAAAIFSLSMIDDCKRTIGERPKAMPALVGLLREGSPIGKKDAATALVNLAVYNPNKPRIVAAGVVPLLVELLMDDKACITDEALGVLALLQGCPQGSEEIKKSRALVPLLIDLLRFGSSKGKENSITLLVGLFKQQGELVARRLLANPRSIPSLQTLAADGSLRARRKAESLLRLLDRCCSQANNSL